MTKEKVEQFSKTFRQGLAELYGYVDRIERAKSRRPNLKRIWGLTWKDILAALGDEPLPANEEDMRRLGGSDYEHLRERELGRDGNTGSISAGLQLLLDRQAKERERLRQLAQFYEVFGGANDDVLEIVSLWLLRSTYLGLASEAQELGKSEDCQYWNQRAGTVDAMIEQRLDHMKCADSSFPRH